MRAVSASLLGALLAASTTVLHGQSTSPPISSSSSNLYLIPAGGSSSSAELQHEIQYGLSSVQEQQLQSLFSNYYAVPFLPTQHLHSTVHYEQVHPDRSILQFQADAGMPESQPAFMATRGNVLLLIKGVKDQASFKSRYPSLPLQSQSLEFMQIQSDLLSEAVKQHNRAVVLFGKTKLSTGRSFDGYSVAGDHDALDQLRLNSLSDADYVDQFHALFGHLLLDEKRDLDVMKEMVNMNRILKSITATELQKQLLLVFELSAPADISNRYGQQSLRYEEVLEATFKLASTLVQWRQQNVPESPMEIALFATQPQLSKRSLTVTVNGTVIPLCMPTKQDCEQKTGNCSGKGTCELRRCWKCVCNAGLAGDYCELWDYIASFHIFFWTSLTLLFTVAASIAMMYGAAAVEDK